MLVLRLLAFAVAAFFGAFFGSIVGIYFAVFAITGTFSPFR